jgi:hypothetical protein
MPASVNELWGLPICWRRCASTVAVLCTCSGIQSAQWSTDARGSNNPSADMASSATAATALRSRASQRRFSRSHTCILSSVPSTCASSHNYDSACCTRSTPCCQARRCYPGGVRAARLALHPGAPVIRQLVQRSPKHLTVIRRAGRVASTAVIERVQGAISATLYELSSFPHLSYAILHAHPSSYPSMAAPSVTLVLHREYAVLY